MYFFFTQLLITSVVQSCSVLNNIRTPPAPSEQQTPQECKINTVLFTVNRGSSFSGRNVMKKQKRNLEQLLCSKLSVKLPELSQVLVESPSELSGGEETQT